MRSRPDRDEAAEYYFTYIDQVPDGDVCELMAAQGREVAAEWRGVSDERSRHRYAAGKWSMRDVVNHVSDCERLFLQRAFWFARGFETPLPSFDQEVAVAAARADARGWTDLVDEFAAVRAATVPFFRSLPAEAWTRRGVASGHPFTVNALAFMCVGHVTHHVRILRERYF
jgi:uncharacterized damage-inducible protein DinB